jgi:hypothetical protein
MLHCTAQVAQTALFSIIVRLLANQSVGMTVSGCAGLVEADVNCAGFLNQLAHTTATEPKWRTLCC